MFFLFVRKWGLEWGCNGQVTEMAGTDCVFENYGF